MQKWTNENVECLQGALESTDWNVFIDTSDNVNELTETVCAYIEFCKDVIIPPKVIKVYANNKPLITGNVKEVINRKRKLFVNGDRNQLKQVQKELNRVIRKEKMAYKVKIEKHFKDNDMKKVWNGMRLMSGFANGKNQSCNLPDVSILLC